MSSTTVKVDGSRATIFANAGERGVPVLINGVMGVAVIDDYIFEVLSGIARTISARKQEYKLQDAIEWAAERAYRRGALEGTVLRLDREDVD